MKNPARCLLCIALFCPGASAHAQNISLRLSVKIVVHPTTGARPLGVNPLLFTQAVTRANQWMASYWRGCRYQLVEVVNIGGPAQGGNAGPSKWFDVNCSSAANWPQFVTNAVQAANPAGGDIIPMRPGSYNERITIGKAVTLRAPRSGWVTIGRSPKRQSASGISRSVPTVNSGLKG